jgi:hypothetical protein
MIIIWRRWGALIPAYVLLVWTIADNVIAPIYRSITGYEFLFNPDKAVCWGFAFFIVAALMFGLNLLLLRSEGKPYPPEKWAQVVEHNVEAIAKFRQKDESDAHIAARQAEVRAMPVPDAPRSSTFFFIPMKWFPIIFAAIGVLLVAVNLSVSLSEDSFHRN